MTAALLAMDLQPSVLSRLPDADAVLRPARAALDAARAAGLPVLFVRVAFRPGVPEIAASNKRFGAMRGAPDESDPAVLPDPSLGRLPDEPLVTKRRVSAFAGSDLDVLLRGRGVDHLVLSGVSTSGVVLSTLTRAADLDLRLTVLADACADGDPEVHRVLTEKVFPRAAEVLSVADWERTLA